MTRNAMEIDRSSQQSRSWVVLTARATALAALLLVAAVNAARAGPLADALVQARHDLAISEQVLARLTERVEVARASSVAGPGERQRLDEYLVHVRALVAANRERVRSLEKLVAEQSEANVGNSGRSTAGAAATEAEQVAMLDQELNNSLEAFDKLLLEEARKARTREAEAGAAHGGGGGSGRAPGKRSAGTRGAAAGGEESASEGGAGESKQAGSREPGTPGSPSASAPPPDIGDGNDDDIVARQIRKAAEAESDPELRKKLWDEYRKYKQGTSQGASG
jgi:cobalamin biosynthesis Mg chelatase CobN